MIKENALVLGEFMGTYAKFLLRGQSKSLWGDEGNLMLLIRLMLVLMILLSLFASDVFASELRFRPKEKHYAAVQLREECSVRRAVLKKVRRERAEKNETLGEIQATLRERRAALEQCAALNGMAGWISEEDELYVAQVCQEQYDLWLTPGYFIEIVEREAHELDRTFEKLSHYLSAYCRHPKL